MYYLAIRCIKNHKVMYLYPSTKKDVMFGYALTTDICQSKSFDTIWEINYIVNLLRKHKKHIKFVDKVLNYEIDELQHGYYQITTLKKVGRL